MDYLVMGKRGLGNLPRVHSGFSESLLRSYYLSNNWEIQWLVPIGSKKFALATLDEYQERYKESIEFFNAVAYQNAITDLRRIIEEFEIQEREL